MNLGTLIATIGGDTRPLEGALGRANTALNRFSDRAAANAKELNNQFRGLTAIGDTMANVGKKMTLGLTLPIAAAGAGAFKLASDYEESLNKVRVAFGNSSSEVEKWSTTTLKSFGIAKSSALDMASLFGDMSTSMGLSTGEASKMSMSLVGLAGDLASFKNISTDMASTALKGIFTGETESLKSLGIVMTEAQLEAFALSQGIKENVKDMTQAEKVNLRYAFVMDATKNSQGDFARTSAGAANQMRITIESLKEAAAAFGSLLLPVITPVIAKLNEFVQWVGALDETTKKWVVGILAVVAAIGPLLFAVGKFTTLLPALITGFKAVRTAMIAMNAAMAANPFVAIAIAVVLLVGLIVTLWKNCETFRAVVKFVALSVAAFFQKAWIQIKMGAEMMWLGIKTYFTMIPKLAAAVWAVIKRVLKGDSIGDAFKEEFGKVFDAVADQSQEIKDKYQKQLDAIESPNYQEILAKEKAVQAGKEAGEETGNAFIEQLQKVNSVESGESLLSELLGKKATETDETKLKVINDQINQVNNKIKELKKKLPITPIVPEGEIVTLDELEKQLKALEGKKGSFSTLKGEQANLDAIKVKLGQIEGMKRKIFEAEFGPAPESKSMAMKITKIAPESISTIETQLQTLKDNVGKFTFTDPVKEQQNLDLIKKKTQELKDAMQMENAGKLQSSPLSTSLMNVSNAMEAAKKSAKTFGEPFNAAAAEANFLGNEIDRLNENTKEFPANATANGIAIDALGEKYRNAAKEAALLEARTIDLGASIRSSMGETFTAIGEGIGNMFSGTADMGDMFSNILGIVADFMSSLGKSLIAAALAGEAFKKLVEHPGLAIAAGVALIALSAVVKNKLSKGLGGGSTSSQNGSATSIPKMAKGGLVSSPTMLLAGEYPGARRDPEAFTRVSVLRGMIEDAVNVGNPIIPDKLTFRVVGADLEAVLNMRSKRMNNLR